MKSKFKIPKRFELLGKTITVEFDPMLLAEKDLHGLASYRADRIVLQPICEGVQRTEGCIEQDFFHEMVHHICYYAGNVIQSKLGDEYLHKNEAFVDLFSSLLHQAMVTMEYK